MVELIELNTERLRLRQWRAADREPFAQLNADPRVMEFFPSPLERSASDAMAEHIQSLISERGWGFWAVEVKEGNEFIGFVGLHTPAPEFPFSPCVELAGGSRLYIGARATLQRLPKMHCGSASSCSIFPRSFPSRQFTIAGRVRSWTGSACARLPKHSSIPMFQWVTRSA